MATVIQGQGINFGEAIQAALGLYDIINTKRLQNTYNDVAMKTLSDLNKELKGKENTQTVQGSPLDILDTRQNKVYGNTPDEWKFADAQLKRNVPEDSEWGWDTKTNQAVLKSPDTSITSYEPLTESEKQEAYDRARMSMLFGGAQVPENIRINTNEIFPWEDRYGWHADVAKQRTTGQQQLNKKPWNLKDKDGNIITTQSFTEAPGFMVGKKIGGREIASIDQYINEAARSQIAARESDIAIELQRLVGNYMKSPTDENKIAVTTQLRQQGLTPIFNAKDPIYKRVYKSLTGSGRTPLIVAVDKNGKAVGIDAMGIIPQTSAKTGGYKYDGKTVYTDQVGNKFTMTKDKSGKIIYNKVK